MLIGTELCDRYEPSEPSCADSWRGELAASGRTIVMAAHEMGFARQVADTVRFLDGGRIIESGSAGQVLTDPQHERTQLFLRRVTGSGGVG